MDFKSWFFDRQRPYHSQKGSIGFTTLATTSGRLKHKLEGFSLGIFDYGKELALCF